MERNDKSDDILLLLDNYSTESRDLHTSFRLAGYDLTAAVIEDDGFLPEGVMSAYGFFLGDFGQKGLGRPRYFNEITVPDYWVISGNNNNGKVHDLNRERGRIFYAEPFHRRLVKVVDWCDDRGVVRSSDHYNRYGALFARTAFNAKGQRFNKTYFHADGQEVIVENYATGDIILNDGGVTRIFRSKTDFVLHFFAKAGFSQSRIFFNSLSTPFFVSQRLNAPVKRDMLFWQEPVAGEIPGNMQVILRGEATRTAQIMVQKRHAYDRLLALGARADMVQKLGFIYPFEKENGHQPEALICTNSDHIEHCKELAEALPGMRFHIAALTEMSSKLMGMGSYENVRLYPNVRMDRLEELFLACDFYFDINHEAEIVSAVRRAFLHNHLIFAFRETLHNADYVADGHIFEAKDVGEMLAAAKEAMADETVLEERLKEQRREALSEDAEAYGRL